MSDVTYQIGQHHYGSSSYYTTKVDTTTNYAWLSANDNSGTQTEDTALNAKFKDVVIGLKDGSNFDTNPYYIEVSIPRNINYINNFDIKLMKISNLSATTSIKDQSLFQFVKEISVSKSSMQAASNVHNITLYKDLDNVTKFAAPQTTDNSTIVNNTKPADVSLLYYLAPNSYYKWDNTNSKYVQITALNNLSVIAPWENDGTDTENKETFRFIFSPIENDFNYLALEMVRNAIDNNISNTDTDGTIFYGRKIDKDAITVSCYKLTNILNTRLGKTSLSKIGVQGHSNLMMAVNKEEIKIGQNNVYELDGSNLIDEDGNTGITFLGIAALSDADYFILDYQYSSQTS